MIRGIKIISRQVYRRHVLSFGYIFMVCLPIVLAIIGSIIFSESNSNKNTYVTIISNDKDIQNTINRSIPNESGLKYKNNFNDLSDAKKALTNKQIDSIFYMDVKQNRTSITYWGNNYKITKYQDLIINYLDKLNTENKIINSNISNQEKINILSPIKVKGISRTSSKQNIQSAVVTVISLLLSVLLIFYCQMISQEIVSEKGTHIVEVILSSMSPASHFYGKFLGITYLFLTQLVVYLFVFPVIAFTIIKSNLINQTYIKLLWNNRNILFSFPVVYTILFGILGIFLYMALSSLVASMVTRLDQVGEAIIPILLLSLFSYYLGMVLMTHKTFLILNVVSYIPFLSQNLMPIRLANGDIPNVTAISTLIITFVIALVFMYETMKIYSINILQYNRKKIILRKI